MDRYRPSFKEYAYLFQACEYPPRIPFIRKGFEKHLHTDMRGPVLFFQDLLGPEKIHVGYITRAHLSGISYVQLFHVSSISLISLLAIFGFAVPLVAFMS